MTLNSGWIKEGAYYYDGRLKVNSSNNYYPRRASSTEIRRLLRESKTSKDREWHPYVAQLKHYNLPCTNRMDKAAAKLRLHEAIDDNKLHLPAGISFLEVRFKEG
jgi:hypothetical protein